jgi:hypothetical protein
MSQSPSYGDHPWPGNLCYARSPDLGDSQTVHGHECFCRLFRAVVANAGCPEKLNGLVRRKQFIMFIPYEYLHFSSYWAYNLLKPMCSGQGPLGARAY